jgi:hypothetical protein
MILFEINHPAETPASIQARLYFPALDSSSLGFSVGSNPGGISWLAGGVIGTEGVASGAMNSSWGSVVRLFSEGPFLLGCVFML